MKITKAEIKALDPCLDGWEWYLKNQEEDLLKLLLSANKEHPDYSRWLFTKLMTKDQCVGIAIYSARLVLDIFEDKYPEDNRPRLAIEAAENWLKDPSEENVSAATYATATAATYATATATTYAARSAAYAGYAAYDAANAAYAANAAADVKNKIINFGISLYLKNEE